MEDSLKAFFIGPLLFSSLTLSLSPIFFTVLQLMCELGNSVINHIYEGACEELGVKKPEPSSPR